MGCVASRPQREETLRRCRDRRRFAKLLVRSRRLLASAHSHYLAALRLSASSLSRFAAAESLAVADHTPPALLRHPLELRPPPLPPLRFLERRNAELEVANRLSRGHLEEDIEEEEREEEGEEANRSSAARKFPRARNDVAPTSDWRNAGAAVPAETTAVAVRHRSLAEIAAAIEEYLVKAAVAGEAVSELLETGYAQLERGFWQAKKEAHRSNGAIGALFSSRIWKPAAEAPQRPDMSHEATLEQVLAWEKRLYKEVKVREGIRIEHDKKQAILQSREYARKEKDDLDGIAASLKKLQPLMIAASEAITATSAAINTVRDSDLALQVADLFYGILNMWRSMNQSLDTQTHIILQVRGLVSRSAGEPMSDHRRQATRQLEAAVSAWYWSLNPLIKYQLNYVCALHGWLNHTLPPLTNDQEGSSSSTVAAELATFCDAWKQALQRLSTTEVSGAMKSFMKQVRLIYKKQTEELRIQRRAARYSKDLDRRCRSLRAVEKDYYRSQSTAGIRHLGGHERDEQWQLQVLDAGDRLSAKKAEIASCRRKAEDEMARHARAVERTRSAMLHGVQAGLPGVLEAMAEFSGAVALALEAVCRRAGPVQ